MMGLGNNPILSHLNQPQQEAVSFKEGPLLILAGPGSGKTRTLVYRAAWLISQKKVPPENILLLTFTNKAAGEMKTRLKKILEDERNKIPWAGTFHSFCAKVLRLDGHFLNIPHNYAIYDESDQQGMIKKVLDNLDLSPKTYKPAVVLNLISQAKNEMITALEYPQYARGTFQETTARIYLKYQQFLKESMALDFDDLLLETVRLFQKEKSVLQKYQNQYHWFLIDEYQDTNHTQYLLTKLLAKKEQNLTVVGDASQAIYSFRGADYRNLVNLKEDFPQLKIINLEQNYRSTENILQAANQVIQKNSSHPILNLWTTKKGGEKISLYEATNEEEEAQFVVNIIKTHLLSIPNSSLNNFVVLYRTNAQSRIIEETLLHSGLPYLLVGGVRFYERKEIKDCLAYLRLTANSQDQMAHKRIEKIGKRKAKKFFSWLKKKPKNLTSLEYLDQILVSTDYLKAFDENDPQDLARIENVKELRSVATNFPDLNQFLENVALIQQEYLPAEAFEIETNQPKSAITLMTVHAAKGTEFPVVFIVGLEEGLFPHARAIMEKDEVEEERRLCYVAMTRAKEKLYLSYAHRRFYFGEKSANQASRFLNDISPELLDVIKSNLV
ncbi:ATP-dependent DNA helicase PcrA [Candidatus Shapirobacteria bacterium CG07_land_8_20_14_0_80_39_12]|uniref:DNA 3'-5' helicase n=3 Tax=Microgenomates group TaxID=1794810 RepID=A0A2M6YPT8_9BACT|nr:MAG: ATP-dependent DNA helicase PcrA [Candidatus Shapirobacteria bacterium CG07_land_8_20_14_0_80_39_12]PJA49448.1 MAG: ATP-dependent DNA helicase PcrA [Candidatus Shapirobacteria bacterium CG_4_9_14_3_um_filter_39_13]